MENQPLLKSQSRQRRLRVPGFTQKRIRTCNQSCLSSRGAVVLLIWSTLIHSCGYYAFLIQLVLWSSKYDYMDVVRLLPIVISVFRAVTYMLYPVAGILAEVVWSRYKMMLTATTIMSLTLAMAAPTFSSLFSFASEALVTSDPWIFMLTGFAQIIFHFCLGVFEANAIQFGVDQLHFAPSDELSRFVHWYYWSTCAFQEILVLGLMHWKLGGFIVMVWISCGSVAVALVIIHCSSKDFGVGACWKSQPYQAHY